MHSASLSMESEVRVALHIQVCKVANAIRLALSTQWQQVIVTGVPTQNVFTHVGMHVTSAHGQPNPLPW